MKTLETTVEIPLKVLESVDTFAELEDDLVGKFTPWKPRFLPCPTKSK